MWRKSIFLATLVALCLLAVPSVTHAQVTNLAPNPSFEEDEVILNDPAWTAWCTWNDAAGQGSTVKIDDTEFIDGLRSLRIDAKGDTDWYFILLATPIPAKVGTTYTASFWAKAQTPRPLRVQMKATDNSVQWGGTSFQVTQDWAEYHFTAASQSTQIKLEFLCGASQSPFWLDFVHFYEGEYVSDIIPSEAGIRPKAAYLEPKNGVVIDQTWVKFAWKAGDFALSHKLYVSESLEALDGEQVQPMDTTSTSLEVGRRAPYPTALTPGQTYYWRVDEVNDLDPNSPWKGDVWSFRVRPLTAWNPSPADGIQYVHPDQDLTWEHGLGNFYHTVYFGESFDQVSQATADGLPTVAAVYDPETMQLGKTYYWRVDEFDAKATHKGDVWSFTVLPEVAVTDPDLLGWWTLDEGMGVTAVDWSGHGNHGRVVGSAQWTHGVHDGALYLSGGANVEVPALNVSTNTVTMTAWVRRDGSQSDWAAVLFKRQGGASGMGFGPANELRYHWTDKYWDFTTGIVPPDQEWFFMAFVVEPMQATLYFNGTDTFARNQATHDPDPFSGVLIVGRDPQGSRDLKGTVDDVRFYNKALSEAQIEAVMRGDLSLAWNPTPAVDAVLDIRDVASLGWSAGDGAVSHNVYFGAARKAVAEADRNSPEFRDNRAAANFSLAGLVDMDSDTCFWRIDEVQNDGTVRQGNVWQFTVLPYLIVDDFESYTNDSPKRLFQAWVDGIGFSPDDFFPQGRSGNGSGGAVGHDIWSPGSPHLDGTIAETRIVRPASRQSMALYYDNTGTATSEAQYTFDAWDWTANGVKSLSLYFYGDPANTGTLYLKINNTKVPYSGDAGDIAAARWQAWLVDLSTVGGSLSDVTKLTIGIEGAGATGIVYFDDIRLIRP